MVARREAFSEVNGSDGGLKWGLLYRPATASLIGVQNYYCVGVWRHAESDATAGGYNRSNIVFLS